MKVESKRPRWLTTVLLLVVVGVWIKVILSFLGNQSAPARTEIRSDSPVRIELCDTLEQYHLAHEYPDPFLRKTLSQRQSQTPARRAEVQIESEHAQAPSIQLLGVITNNATGIRQAILNYNGMEVLVSKGFENDEVRILKIESDQVKIHLKQVSKSLVYDV